MKLPEKLKGLKSIEIHETPDAIAKFFAERPEHQSKAVDNGVRHDKMISSIVAPKVALTVDEIKALATERGVEYDERYADRVIAHFVSDERPDRDGDIVIQEWDFSDFKSNPAMPFNHNWHELPIGVHLDWNIVQRSDTEYSGPALMTHSLYALAEQQPPSIGDSAFRLTKAGMLRGISAGFMSQKVIDVKDEAERASLGLGRYGAILMDNLLMEASPTLLGANQGALAILQSAKKSATVESADMLIVRELCRLSHTDGDEWRKADEQWRTTIKAVFGEHCEKHADKDEPFIEQVETLVVQVEPKAAPTLEEKVDALQNAVITLQSSLDNIEEKLFDGSQNKSEDSKLEVKSLEDDLANLLP